MSGTQKSRRKLLVIGAGIGGLAGAYWARKAGFDVDVIEASASPGGRFAYLEHDGDRISVGAQYFHGSYRDTNDLVNEMGLADKHVPLPHRIMTRDGEGFVDVSSKFGLRKLLGWGGRLSAAYFGARYVLPGRRYPTHEHRAKILAMDDILVSDAVAGMDDRFVRNVVRPACVGLAQGETDTVSMLHLVRMMNMNLSPESSIPGGPYTLIEALCRHVQVELETPAKRLVVEAGRVIGAELEDGSVRRADHTLLAVPGGSASSLIPDELEAIQQNLMSTQYSAAVVPAFFLDRKLEGEVFSYVDHDPSSPLYYAVEQNPIMQSDRSALMSLPHYPTSERLMQESDEGVLKISMEFLGRVIPDFDPNWVVHAAVKRHPFGVPRFPVGQYRRNWELQRLVEDQPGLWITEPRGTHMELSVRRARVAVSLMQRE